MLTCTTALGMRMVLLDSSFRKLFLNLRVISCSMQSSTVPSAAAAGAADTASSQPCSWATMPDVAVRDAFLGCSEEARQTLEALQVGGACRMGACLWG